MSENVTVQTQENATYVTIQTQDPEGLVAVTEGIIGPSGSVPSTLTGGYDSDAEEIGEVSSGTVFLESSGEGKENFKTYTNNGAHTLSAPVTSGSCVVVLTIVNGASAGAITMTGFTIVDGDDIDLVAGNAFQCVVVKNGGYTTLNVKALQ